MRQYPEPYVEFLAHFHGTRDYFECHELLEEYWKTERDPAFREIWHGLIQVAVSAYHERRNNYKGAHRMLEQAVDRLLQTDAALAGLHQERLLQMLSGRFARLQQGVNGELVIFEDPELPIEDGTLLKKCRGLCLSWGVQWLSSSNMNNDRLINRHTLRDRSEVIEERQRQLAVRINRKSRSQHEGDKA
jgi:uncharacterized protein